jgi:hypothetical protein
MEMDRKVGLEPGVAVDSDIGRFGFEVDGLPDELEKPLEILSGLPQMDDLQGPQELAPSSRKCASRV